MSKASEKKIEANRQNAKKSTGPKDTAVIRYNALKHGLLSKEVLIDGESKKTLEELGRRLRYELAPATEMENVLVDRIVSSVWRLKRAIGIESQYIEAEFDSCKEDSWNGTERSDAQAWHRVVAGEFRGGGPWLNLMRYETAIEKQIYKALHELIRLQAARMGEKPPAPIAIDVDISGQT